LKLKAVKTIKSIIFWVKRANKLNSFRQKLRHFVLKDFMSKITMDEQSWIKENYLRLSEMSLEEKNQFLKQVKEIRQKRDGIELFEKDIEDQNQLAKKLGFIMPGQKS
tara:strand:+ start:41572 stop:41895 length:324 start_codon:yes stop_codon:yes gene_type:complete